MGEESSTRRTDLSQDLTERGGILYTQESFLGIKY